jgi:hypothetical protein
MKFTDVAEVLASCVIRAIMEAVNTCETSVNFYQTMRRNNPEDSHLLALCCLYARRRENIKSHTAECKFEVP